jgi:hypothetical protein
MQIVEKSQFTRISMGPSEWGTVKLNENAIKSEFSAGRKTRMELVGRVKKSGALE